MANRFALHVGVLDDQGSARVQQAGGNIGNHANDV
jgi:hypothetical protein